MEDASKAVQDIFDALYQKGISPLTIESPEGILSLSYSRLERDMVEILLEYPTEHGCVTLLKAKLVTDNFYRNYPPIQAEAKGDPHYRRVV